ncbi:MULTISPECIES: M13 family metallopeptidase [Apilactobacillus]|uniref:M13 family metallopeptidase n=1 Tax=Apilactobacillus TaxID=2767877 RepID=UPI00112EAE64|nr:MULTISPECIES: M13-type metalloendopeptidase [Apilactobacillus]TPR18242.1 M13 family peptidase [Apilactobacillus timberlakei]TPR52400.1 M13 family peptidase [Apilactobacillus micheneri]
MNNNEISDSKIRNNFYDAVNGEWIKNATIPSDHSSTGGFMDLVDNIDKTLMNDFKDIKAGKIKLQNDDMIEFKKLYELATDFDKREKDGAKPVKSILEKIENIKSFDDLNNQLANWTLDGLPLPFNFGIEADMKNAKYNALYASGAGTFLPDKTYYDKDNPAGAKLMPVFKDMSKKLLVMAGYNEAQAKNIVDSAEKFDRLIAPNIKSAEESADFTKMYNPMSFDSLSNKVDKFNLNSYVKGLIGQEPDQVIVSEPEYFDAFNKIVNDDTFAMMKNWMLVKTINASTGLLTEEFRQVGGEFSRTLSGKKSAVKKEKAAYYLASGTFDQVIGDYYGHKYFGEKAKQNVYDMVVKMINVYEKRLNNNTWLSEDTKKMAIKKLNALQIHVGYPDKINPLFDTFKVNGKDENGDLFTNVHNIGKLVIKDEFSKWNKPVDKSLWDMSANTVNAYYSPLENVIVFPAAILQAPFYSLKQSSSENFGGIGAVIAHEISHAFDNNGCQFDEEGNLNNWWTTEDHEHFDKLAQSMIKEFDGIPFAGQKVNGKLTVSENIADGGGLSCAEEAAKGEEDCNLRDFFINWAKIWRTKSTEQFKQLLLSIDVHAPSELRAQVQVKNLSDFYTTFDVKPSDSMYMKPEDRVNIW